MLDMFERESWSDERCLDQITEQAWKMASKSLSRF